MTQRSGSPACSPSRASAPSIGAAALAAHRYVRHTEDIDLGVNVAIRDLATVADKLREAGFDVTWREPKGFEERQRWRELFALRAWGNRFAASTPQGRRIRELESEAEARWQAIQRELFARHGGAD